MKKSLTIISLAVAVCACNKAQIPAGNGYGTIDVQLSNDDAVLAKSVISVEDFTSWTIKVGETAYTGADQKFTAGDYTVSASNYANEDAANTANSGWGDAFYQGFNGVTVVAGAQTPVDIACGTAKNARLAVSFNTATFGTFITDYTVTVAKVGVEGGLVFNASNYATTKAYFAAATADVAYTIAYKYNGVEKSINKTITLGAAATEKKITLAANNNGTIIVTITYDDAFGDAGSEEIEIDAATGAEVAK